MKRRHELICREGFDTFLVSKYPELECEWLEPSIDPPDWYLTIGETRFAIEATSISEQLSVGQGPIPSPAVTTSLAAFVDEIEETASEQGILTGAFMISLAPIPNLREHKEELLTRFLEYISNTKDVSSAPRHSLGFIQNNEFSIEKLHSEARYVAELISFGVKSGHEAQDELNTYLANAILTKEQKLQDVKEPIILLILDAYHYSHSPDCVKSRSIHQRIRISSHSKGEECE